MANDLRSGWFVVGVSMPSYERWLLDQDLEGAYRRHRRHLQLLQRHMRRERWVLKCPLHMHGLASILRVYPDARIVWTHRDPAAVVPSAASLLFHFRSTLGRGVDPKVVGPLTLELLAGWVEHGVAARAAYEAAGGGQARFVDVFYDDVVRAPLATVEKIYEAFDLSLPDVARAQMKEHLGRATQHRFGVHRYGLEDYGLCREQVAQRFAGLERA